MKLKAWEIQKETSCHQFLIRFQSNWFDEIGASLCHGTAKTGHPQPKLNADSSETITFMNEFLTLPPKWSAFWSLVNDHQNWKLEVGRPLQSTLSKYTFFWQNIAIR